MNVIILGGKILAHRKFSGRVWYFCEYNGSSLLMNLYFNRLPLFKGNYLKGIGSGKEKRKRKNSNAFVRKH